jgi:ribosomal protein S17
MKYILLIASLTLLIHAARGQTQNAATQTPDVQAPAQATRLSGKVVETMDAAGYTYVLIDTGSKKVWAASTRFAVKVGDSVNTGEAMPMAHYHSKSLNRDFEVVYFTGTVSVNGGQSAAGMATELPKGHPHPPVTHGPLPTKIDLSGIKKAEGGKTIAEIYADSAKLAGQQVKVRGKVVKFNGMIMGKNWLHLEDGTGASGSKDLLVTSAEKAKVGDTVLVTGTIATNKDFGAGYKYAVLIENGKVVAE